MAKDSPNRRTVIYARFSSEKQRIESCDDQIRNVEAMLVRMNIDPSNAVVLKDEALKGGSDDRPGFQRLKEMLYAKQIAILAVDDQSRVTRGDNAMGLVTDLVYRDGRFITVKEGTDTNRRGWQETVKAAEMRNSMFSSDTAHRSRRGMVGRILNDYSMGALPYGYRSEFVDPNWLEVLKNHGPRPAKRVEKDEVEAEIVKGVFRNYADGWSLARIIRDLNGRNIPTGRYGKPTKFVERGPIWTKHRIRAMLKCEKYIGVWRWGVYECIRDQHGKGRRRPATLNEPICREWPWLRIIDQSLWETVQELLSQSKDKNKLRKDSLHPRFRFPKINIGGLISCGHCGVLLHLQTAQQGYQYLTCPDHIVSDTCKLDRNVKAANVEQALFGLIRDIYTNWPEWLEQVRLELARAVSQITKTVPSLLKATEKRLAAAKTKLDNFLEKVADLRMTSKSIGDKVRQLEAEVDEIEAELRTQVRHQHLPEMPTREFFDSKTANLPNLLAQPSHVTAGLLKRLFSKIEIVKADSADCGRAFQLRLKFNNWEMLALGLGPDLSSKLQPWLSEEPSSGSQESPEFTVGIEDPLLWEQWGSKIHELRLQNYMCKDIERELGLKEQFVNQYYTQWKKHKGIRTHKVHRWKRNALVVCPLHKEGKTAVEIAKQTGLKVATVRNVLGALRRTKELPDKRTIFEDRATKIDAMRRSGMKWTKIAAEMRCSEMTVQRILRRWRQENGVKKESTIYEKWGTRLEDMRREGMTCGQIGAKIGCSHASVVRALDRLRKERAA